MLRFASRRRRGAAHLLENLPGLKEARPCARRIAPAHRCARTDSCGPEPASGRRRAHLLEQLLYVGHAPGRLLAATAGSAALALSAFAL